LTDALAASIPDTAPELAALRNAMLAHLESWQRTPA